MWIADNWKDYELIDASNGEKSGALGAAHSRAARPAGHMGHAAQPPPLEASATRATAARHTGGGAWEKGGLPASWTIRYGALTFNVKPMNFKHTGLFPEQAANWDWMP